MGPWRDMITACEFTKTGFRRSDTANRVSRVTGVFPTVAATWTYNCPNDTAALFKGECDQPGGDPSQSHPPSKTPTLVCVLKPAYLSVRRFSVLFPSSTKYTPSPPGAIARPKSVPAPFLE